MRKGQAKKRPVMPDPVYQSELITQAVNKIMLQGKKGIAQHILYEALKQVEAKTKKQPLEVFTAAIENIRPQLELKVRRIGGANYQVPMEVVADRQVTLAIRWLINYARLRPGKTMIAKLTAEIIDAANNTGGAIKKKQDTLKMAEANRAFAHYRW